MRQIPLFKVHVDVHKALSNVREVFESGYINEGCEVTQLTSALTDVLVAKNIVLTNSCTSAITMALKLAGVGPGDEVISTAMTCVATNTPIVSLGADIVWADVHSRSGMLLPWSVEELITKKTKAVVVVAWAGAPPELAGLKRTCETYGVKLILDAAHAFGATYKNIPVHEWVDCTTYSFQAIKHFTTGDGGALVCRDDQLHARAKAMKWFGLDRDVAKTASGEWKGQQWDVDIVEAGYKFNMNNVAAAIGLSQLDHIEKILARHRANAMRYDSAFARKGSKLYPVARPSGGNSSHWVYSCLIDPAQTSVTRDELLQRLNADGIMAGGVHIPNDEYTAFARFRRDLPGVRSFASRQLALPCGWWVTEDDVLYVIDRVKHHLDGGSSL